MKKYSIKVKTIDLNKNLTSRTIIVTISSILINAISMFTAPIFTRLLTTSEYGLYSVFMSWGSIFMIVFGLQTNGSLNNAKIEFDKRKYMNYCSDIYTFSLFVFFIAGIFFAIFKFSIASLLSLPTEGIVLIVLYACGSFSLAFITGFFNVEERVTNSLLISAMFTITSTLLAIFLIYKNIFSGYLGRIIGIVIPQLIIIIYTFVFFYRYKCRENYIQNIKKCLELTIPLVVYGIAGIILAQVDRIMLLSMVSEATAGIYSFCYTMALPITIINGALNTTWVPQYYKYMLEKKYEKIKIHQQRYMFLVVALSCGYILVSPEFVKLLASSEYWNGINIIPLVIVSYFFDFLCLFPTNYEFYLKKTKHLSMVSCAGGVSNIILNYFFIQFGGMYGAAIATILSHIVMFVIHEYIVRYIIKDYSVKWIFNFKGIVPILGCFSLYYFIENNFVVRWGIASAIGIITLYKIIKQRALI